MDRPDISYPVTWEYRVIGTDHWALTSHIAYVMGTSNYTLRDSNKSSGGTYLSIRVSLIVA
ncbi:MAG: HP0495 family protein, partial [Fibrobacterota bacterium]